MKYHAERSAGKKDLIAYIQKQPLWTDPVNNLKELEKLHKELEEKDRHYRLIFIGNTADPRGQSGV